MMHRAQNNPGGTGMFRARADRRPQTPQNGSPSPAPQFNLQVGSPSHHPLQPTQVSVWPQQQQQQHQHHGIPVVFSRPATFGVYADPASAANLTLQYSRNHMPQHQAPRRLHGGNTPRAGAHQPHAASHHHEPLQGLRTAGFSVSTSTRSPARGHQPPTGPITSLAAHLASSEHRFVSPGQTSSAHTSKPPTPGSGPIDRSRQTPPSRDVQDGHLVPDAVVENMHAEVHQLETRIRSAILHGFATNDFGPLEAERSDAAPHAVDEATHRRVAQRKKQILFGKVTTGYRRFNQSVPYFLREAGNPRHPVTPRADSSCSKRRWDLCTQVWRRQLHLWDAENESLQQRAADGDLYAVNLSKCRLVRLDDPRQPVGAADIQAYHERVETVLDKLGDAVTTVFGGQTPDQTGHGDKDGNVSADDALVLLDELRDVQLSLFRLEPATLESNSDVTPAACVRVGPGSQSGSLPTTPQHHPATPGSAGAMSPPPDTRSTLAPRSNTSTASATPPATPGQQAKRNGPPTPPSPLEPAISSTDMLHQARPVAIGLDQPRRSTVPATAYPVPTASDQTAARRRPPVSLSATDQLHADGGDELTTAHETTLPSPAKAKSVEFEGPTSFLITGQSLTDDGTNPRGGSLGFQVECPRGGGAAEVLSQLDSAFDSSKLFFHVVPATATRRDGGSATRTPEHRPNKAPVLSPYSLAQSAQSPARAYVNAWDSSIGPSVPTVVRPSQSSSGASSVALPLSSASTSPPTNSFVIPDPANPTVFGGPRAFECGVRGHVDQCRPLALDNLPNVSYFLSFLGTGLPIVYFRGELPLRPAARDNNVVQFYDSELAAEGTVPDRTTPHDGELAFRPCVSPGILENLRIGAAGTPAGVANLRWFYSPSPNNGGGVAGGREQHLNMQTPINSATEAWGNSSLRPGSAAVDAKDPAKVNVHVDAPEDHHSPNARSVSRPSSTTRDVTSTSP